MANPAILGAGCGGEGKRCGDTLGCRAGSCWLGGMLLSVLMVQDPSASLLRSLNPHRRMLQPQSMCLCPCTTAKAGEGAGAQA